MSAPVIRVLSTPEDLEALAATFDRIWGSRPGQSMFDLPMLQVLLGGGHFASGAFVDGELAGGCIGFHVEPLGAVLHSHIAGVLPSYAAMGLGRALKEHQREWCLERGIRTIRWTYDPLIARNAHFNLMSLGAEPIAYTANYYGAMKDGINAGDDSDRVTVSWSLDDAERRPAFVAEDASALLDATPEGTPMLDTTALDTATVSVRVPRDIERMRLESPATARAWRLAVRDALGDVVGSPDWDAVGFDSASRYVFTRRSA